MEFKQENNEVVIDEEKLRKLQYRVYVLERDNYKTKKLKDKYSPVETIYLEDENDKIDMRFNMKDYFCNKAKEICPDDDERLNIILDMCYGYKNNKQFCWDCIGDLILKRLEEMENDNN